MNKTNNGIHKAKIWRYNMDMLGNTGDYYLQLDMHMVSNDGAKYVRKTYYLTTEAAKQSLYDELGLMGQQVDQLVGLRAALDACIGLELRLKVKVDSNRRNNYYILGKWS